MQSEPEVAIVTGGAGGIGEAAARAIARRGARVALADLRPAAAAQAAARLQAEALDVEPVTVDVGSEASVRATVETVLGRWGRIDILVNNAGVESSKSFLAIGVEEYEQVMRVNATGVWLCCQAVIPTMLRQGSGCIVNVSSVAGQRGGGLLGTAAYSTSKGAVIALVSASRQTSSIDLVSHLRVRDMFAVPGEQIVQTVYYGHRDMDGSSQESR